MALVALRRVGLPCASFPALSCTVTRMSTLRRVAIRAFARSVPLANVDGQRPVGMGRSRRTSSSRPRRPTRRPSPRARSCARACARGPRAAACRRPGSVRGSELVVAGCVLGHERERCERRRRCRPKQLERRARRPRTAPVRCSRTTRFSRSGRGRRRRVVPRGCRCCPRRHRSARRMASASPS